MRRIIQVACAAVGVPVFLLIGCFVADDIAFRSARPPESVTDISSCLTWLQDPMGVYRITDGDVIYYRLTGPAGRCIASGLSAYTFDSQGKFIGWTADVGDFPTPGLHLSQNAKREKISLDELRKSLD
jgi:hypothetical protein